MRERLKELGGRLEIQSDPTGTILTASVPCHDVKHEVQTNNRPRKTDKAG
jgi:signal transduction histidine kinase